jgi:lipopolysaccharide transport system permease protein
MHLSPFREALPTRVVSAQSRHRFINIAELWQARELLYFLTARSIKVRYAQSILGLGWAVVQPLFSMLIFTVFFGRFAGVLSETVPYAVFVFAALVPWTFFAGALSGASNGLKTHASIWGRVYFPRLIGILEPIASKLVDFAIAFIILMLLMLIFQITPTLWILALPIPITIMVLTVLGISLWTAPLALQYRDVNHALVVGVPLLLYATPVVFSLDFIPTEYHILYAIYPMVGVIEAFRASMFGTGPMPWSLLIVGGSSAICLVISGGLFFKSMERVFDDVV